MEIYESARRHGIEDEDILHAVEHAVAIGDQDDGKVLYLGPERAANLLEVVAVRRDNESGDRDPRHARARQVRAVPPR
ncbi:MAG: hypothetical protein ACRDZ0_01750 [Acidimicrobiales bacterium]